MLNITIDSYNRNVYSSIAEEILNRCSVYIDTSVLHTEFIINKHRRKSSLFRIYKEASTNNGYIKSKYYGQDKRTFRIFSCKGYPNLINESDPTVLKSIKSRYQNGYIVEFDYKIHEYSIMLGILGIKGVPEDIHQFVQDLLGVDRAEAKRIDSTMLYGRQSSATNMVKSLIEAGKHDTSTLKELCEMFDGFRAYIDEFNKKHTNTYQKYGCVINQYGRKIYPKEESTIFNNMIQSVGSEILIDNIIKIEKLFRASKTHLLFHRFDSLFFDIEKESLSSSIKKIKNTMENINPDLDLKVSIGIGGDMLSIREL